MQMPRSLTTSVCVLGAGPHGLSAVLHLLEADPRLADDITVIDPSGEWMSTWHEQFARLEIGNLRSPGVHHPSPDVDALGAFTASNHFESSGLPYNPPTTAAFSAFTRHLVDDAGLAEPLALQPRAITPVDGSLIVEADSTWIRADRVVVATNPHRRSIPDWVWPLCGRTLTEINHAADVDLRALPELSGESIVIIGGGLTAAHLAVGAAARGAVVDVVSRRAIRTSPFDTDPGWLGPKYLDAFDATADPVERIEIARQARDGGSVPPWMRSALEGPSITLHEAADVIDSALDAGCCELRLKGGASLRPDRIWLATGTVPDIDVLRCLGPLLPDVASVDGLPVTDQDLRLGLHPIHVMGRLATVTLGPAAGNLWGARHAARRITRAITGIDVENLSTRPRQPRRTRQ